MTFGFNRSHQAYGPNRVQLKEFSNSAAQHSNAAPFKVAIVYNQSAHAVKMVVDELRSEWGNTIKIIQVIGDNQAVSNVDASIKIDSSKWNDLDHFEDRLNQFKLQNPSYRVEIESKKTAFTAVWSGFAEAGSTGRKVEAMGLIWTGTTPDISDGLEKMGFKEFCDQVGAPTPEWFKLPNAENIDDSLRLISEKCTSGSWMIKSIFGGGGVGTKSFSDVKNISDVKSALKRVIGETKSAEGIYLEKKVDVKGGFYQGEFEVDGNQVAHGTRIVWFNANNAKVLEIGCQDEYIDQLGMPIELIQKIKDDSKKIAEISKNNTRGTIEALIYKTDLGEWAYTFIEMNRRPQVENEALAYLEMNPKTGLRRKTFVESFKRACGVPATPKVPSNVKFIAHGRILVGDPNSDGVITNHLGTIKGMSGPLPADVEAESICEGEISATSNPQHGRVLISGQSFQDVCEKLATYFKSRKPVVDGVDSTYGEGLASIIGSEPFKKGKIASERDVYKKRFAY